MSDKERELTRYSGELHEGADHSAPYPVSRMAPAIELVDLAKQIADADQALTNQAHGKLRVIAEQVQTLQAQAQAVLEQTRRDQELHRAECRFNRIPGKVYHLYRRANGKLAFSMVGPEDWGGSPPHTYEGAYRLENDQSWTPAEKLQEPDHTTQLIDRLLTGPQG